MGLLDNLDPSTETGQRFLGLLAAAGPQTDPTKTSYAARLKMAEDGVQDWKQNKLMGEYRQAQMDAQKRQLAAQEAQAKQAAVQQEALGKLFNLTGGGGGFSPATDGVFDGSMKYTQPTPQKLQLNQQAVLEAARLGVPPEALQKYAELQNIGQSKVARTIKGMGPDGKEYEYQVDERGNKVGDGFAQFKAPIHGVEGGDFVARDGYTMQPLLKAPVSMTFGDRNAAGNLALSRERLAFDKAGGVEGIKPKLVGEQWVTAPTDMKAGEVRSAMPSTQQKDAKEALQLIETAREIIPKSTGSYAGAGVDQAARLFGISTGGDTAAAQLKALEGALVSKMPKMSGPQSDKDVLLYKQMAGEIGDPTIPQARKLAALQVIEQIQQRHSGQQASPQSPSNPPMDSMPSAVQYKGRTIRDMRTGKMLTSNGMQWVEAQ